MDQLKPRSIFRCNEYLFTEDGTEAVHEHSGEPPTYWLNAKDQRRQVIERRPDCHGA